MGTMTRKFVSHPEDFHFDYYEAQLQTSLYIIWTSLEQIAASKNETSPPVQRCFENIR